MKTLTVDEAAKKLSDCVEQVYSQHESFELVKKGVPQALLVPINGISRKTNTHELADDLAGANVSIEDRRAHALAIRKGRARFKPLKNPWA